MAVGALRLVRSNDSGRVVLRTEPRLQAPFGQTESEFSEVLADDAGIKNGFADWPEEEDVDPAAAIEELISEREPAD